MLRYISKDKHPCPSEDKIGTNSITTIFANLNQADFANSLSEWIYCNFNKGQKNSNKFYD